VPALSSELLSLASEKGSLSPEAFTTVNSFVILPTEVISAKMVSQQVADYHLFHLRENQELPISSPTLKVGLHISLKFQWTGMKLLQINYGIKRNIYNSMHTKIYRGIQKD
jgi:hypothetical protein